MRNPFTLSMMIAALAVVTVGRHADAQDRTADSIKAFRDMATVIGSARCANCHITGDAPLQGDDGRPHSMNVVRGQDGRGAPAMRCTNCHQDASSPVPHAPPGAPDWRLPAAATPMAWRGLTAGEQCRLLKDPLRNGNRDLPALLDHLLRDPLVIASWSPGPGRSVPPISHEAFVASARQWIEGGAACPE